MTSNERQRQDSWIHEVSESAHSPLALPNHSPFTRIIPSSKHGDHITESPTSSVLKYFPVLKGQLHQTTYCETYGVPEKITLDDL